MTMKVSVAEISSVQRRIEVEFPPERVQEELEKSYRGLQQRIRLRGFRAGKAPRGLLERHFGEQVAEEVGSRLIEESYVEILDQHSLPVVARPQIVAEKVVPGQAFHYSAMVEIKPEVTLGDYQGLEVEREQMRVGEEEVAGVLSRLQEALAQVRPVTDRDGVEKGDTVTLDYAGFVDGQPMAGLRGESQTVEVGSGSVLPEFEERLVGIRRGVPTEFALAYPVEGGPVGLAGKTVTFRVTVREIGTKELPPLDDEFAKDHGECGTLAELQEKVRADLQAVAERRTEARLREELLAQLVTRNPIAVPESLVERQFQRLVAELRVPPRPGAQGQGEAELPAQVREELLSRARRQVQGSLLLDALARQQGLVVSDAEVDSRLAEIVAGSGEHRRQVHAYYEQEENRQALRARLLQEKALGVVVDRAKVKTVDKNVAPSKEKE
jgi:trigger factor